MNKSFVILAALASLAIAACEKDKNDSPYESVTIHMDANSSSDVYTSLAMGEVKAVARTDWDIAFSTPTQSATVLINEGAGVELYCVGDSTDWDNVNESSIAGLQPRFNDKTGWLVGAFNRNADVSDVFNFGWGHYNFADHNVYGDSIYIIKLTDGSLKKFFYRKRTGGSATHHLKWANPDGSSETQATVVATSYVGSRNFIHYSIVNQQIVEAEPLAEEWDLLFTRYITQIPTGPASFMNYPVMGILSNSGVQVARVTGVHPEKAVESDAPAGYSSLADAIGYDWKVSDPITHAISLVDSLSYFIQAKDGKKYQLYFTHYGGSEEGTIEYKIKPVE